MPEVFSELGCPVCGGELHIDGRVISCRRCSFRGANDEGIFDLRVHAVEHEAANLSHVREPDDTNTATTASSSSSLESDHSYAVLQLFWPTPRAGGVVHIGFGADDWRQDYPRRTRREYRLEPAWPPGLDRSERELNSIRVASANAERLPFQDATMVLVSVLLPSATDTATSLGSGRGVDSLLARKRPDAPEAPLFEEVRRILKPDGALVLVAPNRFSYQLLFSRHATNHRRLRIRQPVGRSLRGYRTLLRMAGFTRTTVIGLLDPREQTPLAPFRGSISNWQPRKIGSMKERIKSHPWFVHSFGVRASSEPNHETCWDQIIQQLSAVDTTSSGPRFQRCVVTGKKKALFFGVGGHGPVVLKVPLDETSRASEQKNWKFIEIVANISAVKAPKPIHRGGVHGFEYFVEQRVVGNGLSDLVDRRGEAAAIDLVGDFLERAYEETRLVSTTFDDALLTRFVSAPIESLAAFIGASERLDALSDYLATGLAGTPATQGLTHGDLSVSNVILADRHVAGVIDWADAVSDGLPALDVVGHVESRIRRAHDIALADALAVILEGGFRDNETRSFVERFFALLQISPETFSYYVHLYWLHHMCIRGSEAAHRSGLRTREQIQNSLVRLNVPR